MQLKRRTLILGTGAATASAMLSSVAHAKGDQMDPDIESIKKRLMTLEQRGPSLSPDQKYIVLLSTATTQALAQEVEEIASSALKAKVSPVLIREAVYQVAPYVGLGRVQAVLEALNRSFKKAGVKLPLTSQTTVNDSNRLEKGIEVQVSIFGEGINKMHRTAPEGQKALLIDDLSGYCFGDFYTRNGMSIKDRELAVFAAIAALGGCESQLKAHTHANLKEGNNKQNLIDALQIAVPLNGFPRTLNALAVVNSVQ